MESNNHIDVEISEISETFRATFRLAMNASAILTTATITLMGFAISNKSAALVCLGAFFPIVLMVFLFYMYRIFIAAAFSAIRLEKFTANVGLFASAVTVLLDPSLRSQLSEIVKIDDPDRQIDQLRESYRVPFTPFTHIFLPTWSIMQILGSIAVWYYFEWPFVP